MPQIWTSPSSPAAWIPTLLVGEILSPAGGVGEIVRVASEAGEEWALVAPPGAVCLNGEPLALGLRVLRDKDEVSAGAARMFYSSERLAVIEPFAGSEPVVCPRCKQPVNAGDPSVRCPGCGVVCHESEEFPCFTYTPSCPLCSRSSALNEFTWTPEDVEG